MKITIIKPDELCEVMQHLNILKVKFGPMDTWIIAPMLFATEESVDIVVNLDSTSVFNIEDEVIIKFQRFGYEYIVSGKVAYKGSGQPVVITVKLIMAQRYFNLRKYMRFDTNLKVTLEVKDRLIESIAKNISRGGAMVVSGADIELNSLISIKITFTSQNSFTATARVLRKSVDGEKGFSYGIQFVEISEDNNKIFNKEILKYEREYLKTLDILKEYTNKNDSYFDAKISILCYDADESYEIREILVKIGAENFEIFHNFKFYSDFFSEEKPKVVVIDTDNLNDEIAEMLQQLTLGFPDIQIMLLIPLGDQETEESGNIVPKGVSVLYKPLIYNEFEKEMLKYL
ncbi:MAG: PilZ domain-containing protein [Clostridia bacterium]|nr:PilZ domain-containing protein [Clostridia bacterium]